MGRETEVACAGEATHIRLERAQFAWLAAAAYPYLSDDHLQICADLMQWYFLYDDAYLDPDAPDAMVNSSVSKRSSWESCATNR